MLNRIKQYLRSYIVEGVLMIVLGVLMLIYSGSVIDALCRIVGILLIVFGGLQAVSFFMDKDKAKLPQTLLTGLLLLGLGIALASAPKTFANILFVIVGVLLLYGSVLMLANAYNLRKTKGPLFLLSLILGLITLALGVVILFNPDGFKSFIVTLQGIALIVEGISMIAVLSRLKKDVSTAGSKEK